jgi:hypothetical protein
MSSILIEKYRGFEINFNPDEEVFHSIINDEDGKRSKSFSAVKKAIDEYIKENENFEPFYVINISNFQREFGEKLKIISIRKDGRFMFENKKKEKEQLSLYHEKKYILYDPKVHDMQLVKLVFLSIAVDDANKAYSDYKEEIKGQSLTSFKEKIQPVKKSHLF